MWDGAWEVARLLKVDHEPHALRVTMKYEGYEKIKACVDTQTALIHTSRGVSGRTPVVVRSNGLVTIIFPLPKSEEGNPLVSLTHNITLNLEGVGVDEYKVW